MAMSWVQRMRKVGSAPALLGGRVERAAANADDDDDAAHHIKSHSIGDAGCQSPTGQIQVRAMHAALCTKTLLVRPEFKVEIYNTKLYCMVFWFPMAHTADGVEFPFVQKDAWHCSLAVGWPQRGLTAEDLDNFCWIADHMWDALMAEAPQANGAIMLPLDMPPWPRSLTFGIRESYMRRAVRGFQAALERWMLDMSVFLREPRPLHVSWR